MICVEFWLTQHNKTNDLRPQTFSSIKPNASLQPKCRKNEAAVKHRLFKLVYNSAKAAKRPRRTMTGGQSPTDHVSSFIEFQCRRSSPSIDDHFMIKSLSRRYLHLVYTVSRANLICNRFASSILRVSLVVLCATMPPRFPYSPKASRSNSEGNPAIANLIRCAINIFTRSITIFMACQVCHCGRWEEHPDTDNAGLTCPLWRGVHT